MSVTKQKKMLQFLRTKNIYENKDVAIKALEALTQNSFDALVDGTPVLARYYTEEGEIKTLLGMIYSNGDDFSVTIYDDGSDNYEEFKETIKEITDATGLHVTEDGFIEYVPNEEDPYLSGATDLYDADKLLSEALAELSELVDTNEVHIEKIGGEYSGDVRTTYALFNADGVQLGDTIEIYKDQFLKKAELVQSYVSGGTLIEEPALELTFIVADGTVNVVDLPVKDLIDTTDIASDKELKGVEDAIGLSEDEILSGTLLTAFENTYYLSGESTIVDAINKLDGELKRVDDKEIHGLEVISANTEEGNTDIILNYVHVNEEQTAGLTSTMVEGVEKLDVDFDFGEFEWIIVYARTADDVNNIENPASVNLSVETAEALAAAGGKTFKSLNVTADFDKTVALNAVNDVTLSDLTISGTKDGGNGKVVYNTPVLTVRDVIVEDGSTIYNVFEGTQNGNTLDELNADNVTVDNTSLKHNVFNVYMPSDDAVISVKNSTFNLNVATSNVMRLSNYKNATGVTVMFDNVDWTYENKTYSSEDAAWAGLLLYQPAGGDVALTGDLGALETWTFVFKNCKYNGVKVTDNNFGTIKQAMYLYDVNGVKEPGNPENLNVIFE